MDRTEFENAAYSGYVSRGIGDTDGWYHPIDKTAFVDAMRLRVPVMPEDFTRYNDTEFRPTEQQCREYNLTFTSKPKVLRLAVKVAEGWRTVEVAGTKDAHEVLGRIAATVGFTEARLEDYANVENGYWVPQIRYIAGEFVGNNKAVADKKRIRRGDRFGKYAELLKWSESSDMSI
jgi:hypothetical protein